MNLSDMVRKMQELGYETDDAEARVCQDIVLKAISKSTLSDIPSQMSQSIILLQN